MKRSTPLTRSAGLTRKPMKRSRGPLSPEVRAARSIVRERSGDCCEIATAGCMGRAAHFHHVLPRSHGGPDLAGNYLHACQSCHRFAHENPALAYANGWIKRSTTP